MRGPTEQQGMGHRPLPPAHSATSGIGAYFSHPAKQRAPLTVSPNKETEMTESIPPETGSKPTTPRGLLAAGRRLWDSATTEYDWAAHELIILVQGCQTLDRINQLDAAVAKDGLIITSSQGNRVHPAVAEARQQRLTLARLLVSLGIPALEGDDLPTTRGIRGVYGKGRR